jgi:hypothetical protein
MWPKLLISLFLLSFSTQLCSPQFKESNGEKDFYRQYPFFENKIESVLVHIESSPFREVKSYYRISVDENTASEFLRYEKYIGVNNLSESEMDREDTSGNVKISFKCDSHFVPSSLNQQSYPQWWDIHNMNDKKCYVKRPVGILRQRKAVYDQSKRILYIYDFIDG